MGYYQRYRGRGFQEKNGIVKVFQTPIYVALTTNQQDYELEEKSSVERNIAVGLWVDEPASTAQKVTSSGTIADADVFNSAQLTLRRDDQEVLKRIPLRQIQKANDQGHPYWIEIGESINLSESFIEVFNSAGISAGEILVIRVDYLKRAR